MSKKKDRKVYIQNIRTAYEALQGVGNFGKLDHHGVLEQTLLNGKRIEDGKLIDLLQLSIIHDLHGENDPTGEKPKFEPEYARCITTPDSEFETRLDYVNTLFLYARNASRTINGKGMSKWREARRDLKSLRMEIVGRQADPHAVQSYMRAEINESRQTLVQLNLYLSQAYHFRNSAKK